MKRTNPVLLATAASGFALATIGCDAATATTAAQPLATEGPLEGAIALRVPGMEVTLAPTADGEHRVVDGASGVGVGFRLRGARRAPIRAIDQGAFAYDDAIDGAWIEQRARAHGVEDLFHFAARPREERVTYDVDVRGAAGLRHVGNVLELLDERGVPRLRVDPPSLVDATGRVLAARLDVEGCAFDADPRSPIGRALVDKRTDACVVSVDWSRSGAAYPLVLDPAWVTAGNMTEARADHTVTAIAGGAIAIGGTAIPALAEIYDATEHVWTPTGGLVHDRRRHAAASLPDGSVLVAAGWSTETGETLREAERYDRTTGVFTKEGVLSVGRTLPQVAVGAGGRVAIIGGLDWVDGTPYESGVVIATADVFDPATNTWATSGPDIPRTSGFAAALPDGRILVGGGTSQWLDPFAGEPLPDEELEDVSIFDPASLTWSAAANLLQARYSADAIALANGKVLVFGGWDNGFGAVHKTEIYDPADDTWTATADQSELDRLNSFGVRMPNGAVMVTGGCCTLRATEVFLGGAWQLVEKLSVPRNGPRGALLENGEILVAGGWDATLDPLDSSELFVRLANGLACTSAVECGSAVCSEGICCDVACADPCMSCVGKETGGPDGACLPVIEGRADPTLACVDTLANSCGTTGRCDGAGACARYPAGTTCAASACETGAGQCDDAGNCSCASPTCSVDGRFYGQTDCAPYRCDGSGCGASCATSTACANGYVCDATGHCIVESPPAPAGDGCDVSTAATSSGSAGALALASAALVLSIQRRRAARRGAR